MRMNSAVLLASSVALAAAEDAPPNILILLTDDQGWGDNEYNCENSTAMCARTPNMRKFAMNPHSALFHRFYSASSVCSPTRATILTGRSNQRDCIASALPCCQENPAPTCAQGVHGGLPWPEFTVAKAAKKSALGDYATIQLGKWHLGDLWEKGLPGMRPEIWSKSDPGDHGFDEWLTTQAEASNAMPNCGCFPVNHTHPGPKPPSGSAIFPTGDQCVVGGGEPSDWAYPCTQYYSPSTTDPRKVTDSARVPGDDSTWLVDHFETFLDQRTADRRPWLAHICFHAIHEPHPAMPEFYHQYANDPDYLGALTMWDAQIGRLMGLLEKAGVDNNTAIFYTTDNGPHQGLERTDIHYSTNQLRQCKASMWEGGIRVPGIMHYPPAIKENMNITTPATTADFLPTIMSLLQVTSDNPTWAMDGIDLLPVVEQNQAAAAAAVAEAAGTTGAAYVPRAKELGFWTMNQYAIIDNNWKIVRGPGTGQCDMQPPYDTWKNLSTATFLFDLDADYHELHDLSASEPAQLARMSALLDAFLASVNNSQANEVGCGKYAPPPAPTPPPPPTPLPPKRSDCSWAVNMGQHGSDLGNPRTVASKEECCGLCWADAACKAADYAKSGLCHLKGDNVPIARNDGSISCLALKDSEVAAEHWAQYD